MLNISPEQYQAYAREGYTRVPISCDVVADTETAVSCYLKLANQPFSYLFESVQGGEKWSRYSFIGLDCQEIVRISGNEVSIERQGEVVVREAVTDPLAWLEAYQAQFKVVERTDLPTYHGGFVGYFAYDTVRYVEPRLQDYTKPDPIGAPDILLMLSENLVVFDNLRQKMHLITHVNPQTQSLESADARLQAMQQALQKPLPTTATQISTNDVPELVFASNTEKSDYLDNVENIRQYIQAGDAMQVVYSQRWAAPFTAEPFALYRQLRRLNPSPYLFYLHLGDVQIIGSSPEILVRSEEGKVTVRPLAGTRPRGQSSAEDVALAEELLADHKELAEHLMLIDLGRNDVGKISQTGSVQVTEQMNIERYSHVMHVVSEVQGILKPELSCLDALKATLPAGTLSGAPKSRAMEIIDELEPEKRGVYGGAIGYLSWQGQIDTAIAIRTAVIKNNYLYVQAGAGIVYDSDPEKEWEESMNKAQAIMTAARYTVAEQVL